MAANRFFTLRIDSSQFKNPPLLILAVLLKEKN